LKSGGQLVKILGKGFLIPPGSQPIIKFGEVLVNDIYSIKRNVIVVETPASSKVFNFKFKILHLW
jgi:hypothetical protein